MSTPASLTTARDLIDRAAARPWDCSSSDLRPILPSSDKAFDSEVGRRRVALLAMCVRHVLETGDGELSFFLGDTLQHLPECEAYVSQLIDADRFTFDLGESCGRRIAGRPLESGDVSDVANGSLTGGHGSLS